MTKYLTVAVLILILVYGFIEAWPLIAGPMLSVASPVNNSSFPGGTVVIRGKAARAAQLTLNGSNILHEEDGTFLATRTFPKGGSILTLVAVDRFGRTVTDTRTVFIPF